MLGCLQTKYKRSFFKFVQLCLAFFTFTKVIEYIIHILNDEHVGGTNTWYVTLSVISAFEITVICFLGLFCNRILREFQGVIDPELILKRRQLIWLLLMYFVHVIHLAALMVTSVVVSVSDWPELMLFMSGDQDYIFISSLFIYFILTLFPRNAITGFDKVPN
jgi:hypothetical protein